MEGLCCISLHSPSLTALPCFSSLYRSRLVEKPFLYGQFFIKSNNIKAYPIPRNLELIHVRAQASSTKEIRSEAGSEKFSKDDNLAFVAGATGKVGSRTVRELLKLGFKVRAGIRSAQKAETLVQSVKQLKLNESEASGPLERLEIVECDLEKPNQIAPALANSSVVICCIGASEKEVFDVTGPYRIDYRATKNLIDSATAAKVKHFILLTSLGTNKVGFPAAILNLFWGVLIWKRKAEEALLASGLPYTIVRPGGMERPTDSYKETHNITLSPEDTLFGGQVSNLQVAEVIAFTAKNLSLSCCKVVEVIAETTAPLTPFDQLLAKIPSQRTCDFSVKESDVSVVFDSKPTETEPVEQKAKKSPLSPYIVYEDLKPPTSPTPTPPINQKPKDLAAQADITEAEPVPEKELVIVTKPLSPFTAYDDLKPPTLPSPSAPNTQNNSLAPAPEGGPPLQERPTLVNSNGPSPPEDKPVEIEHRHSGTKTRPLSPFPMYEDLKPPASPVPSPRKS